MPELISVRPEGLYCEPGGFFIDPWQPVERAVLTHAHGDHAWPGSPRYLCAAPGLGVTRRRLPDAVVEGLAYGEPQRIGDVTLSFHPAGHVLGSAQVRLEHRGEVWVVSGDYKRASDPTCAPFEPQRCDVFITEATFGSPLFRWDAPGDIARDILAWWQKNRADGRASVLFCYVLGKAQRVLAELGALTDDTVYLHGMMAAPTALYREAGVRLAPTALVSQAEEGRSFAGELILAPPSARGTPWAKRFGDYSPALASGAMRLRGTRRRQGYERGFALSDHADWPALLSTVRETQAPRVLVTHGYADQLARYLRGLGLDAQPLSTRYEGEVDE